MNLIEYISNLINKGETAFLLGAGISINSGIPIVSSIYDEVLEILEFSPSEKRIFWESTFPFETFMASIKEVVPEYFTFLLNIFKAENPSSNHQFISNCIKANLVSSVFTTNFDDLLQKELDKWEINYETYFTQKHLQSISLNDKSQIVHLHGFIRSKRTIATTIERVAGLWGIESRKKAVGELLNYSKHKTIISIGYSYSDIFDIVPLIEAKENKGVSFIMFDYSKDSTEIIQANTQDLPFKDYPNSYLIKTDIDTLINELNRKIFNEVIDQAKYTTQWKEYISLLFGEFSNADKSAIKAKIFILLDRPDLSLQFYKQALSESKDEKRDFFNSLYINQLNETGNFEEAIKLAKLQLLKFKNLKFKSSKLQITTEVEIRLRIAVASLNLGELDISYQQLIKTKALIDDNKLYKYVPECYFYLTDILIARGEFSKVETLLKDALGNCAVHTPSQLPMMLGKLSDIYYVQGNSEEGLVFAKQAWELSKDHGDISDINASLCRLLSLSMSLGDIEYSLLYSTEIEEITPKLRNLVDKAFNHSILGKHFSFMLEHFRDANRELLFKASVDNLKVSIDLFNISNMDTERILALSELARTYAIYNKVHELEDIESLILKEIPLQDRHSNLEVYDCMSDAFQRINNRIKSMTWLNKLIKEINGDKEYEKYYELLNINSRIAELSD